MFLKLFFELGIILGVIQLNPLLDLPNSLEDRKAEFIICTLSARFKTVLFYSAYMNLPDMSPPGWKVLQNCIKKG